MGKGWKDELYKYMTGIIRNHGHKVLAINGMPDHIHIFFGMRPVQSLSDLMKHIKGDSSEWINEKKTFMEEYTEFLKAFDVEYDERYIFKPIDY